MLNKIASETTQIKQDTDIGVGEKKFSFTLCFFGWSDDINMKWIDRRNSHLILYVQEPTYMMDFKTERYNEVYICVCVCEYVYMPLEWKGSWSFKEEKGSSQDSKDKSRCLVTDVFPDKQMGHSGQIYL